MGFSKEEKEEIKQMIDQALDLFNQNNKNVEEDTAEELIRFANEGTPDFGSWKENGIKSKLANIIIAPEDYFEGDKKFFTWDEAVAAQEKMSDGWRLPTRQEMVLMCEEFGRPDPNGDYDSKKLCENLKLGKNGYVHSNQMGEYDKNPAKFGHVYREGEEGNYWAVESYSVTRARSLCFYGNYTYPEDGGYRSYGFSVRCVRDTEFPEKGENQ